MAFDATSIIALSGAVIVPVTALLLNYRGLASIDSRFGSIDSRFAAIDNRFASLERRLDVMERDLKDFYRLHYDLGEGSRPS